VKAVVNSQAEDIVSAWARFQKYLWDGLCGIDNELPGQQHERFYSRYLGKSEELVNYMLQLHEQSAGIRIIIESLKPGKEVSSVTSDWMEQAEKAALHWVGLERQAWKAWFAAIKHLDLYYPHGSSRTKAKHHTDNVIEAGEEITRDPLTPICD
jgi:hypothetical protein